MIQVKHYETEDPTTGKFTVIGNGGDLQIYLPHMPAIPEGSHAAQVDVMTRGGTTSVTLKFRPTTAGS